MMSNPSQPKTLQPKTLQPRTLQPRTLKERQRQEREDLILEAAEELMLEKGYHEMAIEDIAARVGISKGTVYLHFPSKEELVFAMTARAFQALLQALETIFTSELAPGEKIRAILALVFGNTASQRYQVMHEIAQNPELRVFMESRQPFKDGFKEHLAQRFQAIMEEGKARGEFDAAIPTPIMLGVFSGMLIPWSHHRLIADDHFSPDVLVDHVSHIFLKGIAAETPQKRNHA